MCVIQQVVCMREAAGSERAWARVELGPDERLREEVSCPVAASLCGLLPTHPLCVAPTQCGLKDHLRASLFVKGCIFCNRGLADDFRKNFDHRREARQKARINIKACIQSVLR